MQATSPAYPHESTNVVLHSGGIDSSALLHFYSRRGVNVRSIFINYGQLAASMEYASVRKVCSYYQVESEVIEVKSPVVFSEGNVVGRNLFLISSALMFANINTGIIAIGVHAGTSYVDCNKPFIEGCRSIFDLYTGGRIALGAPFLSFTKYEIIKYCNAEKVPLHLTYSCEKGEAIPCGQCSTCKEITNLYASQVK